MPRKGVKLSPEAEKRNKAQIAEWHRENTENLSIGLRKGKREAYKRLAAARGLSVAGMIQDYMDNEYYKEFKEDISMTKRYQYTELLAAATAPDAQQKDIDALGEWFEEYGTEYWNGEYFDADGARLFPIQTHDEETDTYTIIGYEFK